MNLREKLSGTGVAIITPFKKNLDIDFDSLGKLIDFNLDNGVNYIVTLGTTGETPVLSKDEKNEVILFTYAHVNKRVPVVVGAGSNDTASLVKELGYLPLKEATAVLSASPYYNKPSQEGLYQHYKHIAEASPVPIILYNVPGRTGRNMEALTTLKLAEINNIAGIKEASGDMAQCMEILKYRPENFLVVSGDDALALPQLACGMVGVISVAANAFPKDFSNLVDLCLKGKFREAKKINDKLLEAYFLLFNENNPAGLKAFLQQMKIVENVLRLPGVPVSDKSYQAIEDYLKNN